MNSSSLLSIVTFIYGLAGFLYIAAWVFKKEAPGKMATWTAYVGLAGNLAGIILRWVESHRMGIGHAPLSNLYESLVFFSFVIVLIYLVVERQYKNRAIGAFTIPIAFLAMAYASMPSINKQIQPLIPALKSNWLIAHVMACFVGYSAFAIAFGVSLMYLMKKDRKADGIGAGDFLKPVVIFLFAALLGLSLLRFTLQQAATLGLAVCAVWLAAGFVFRRVDPSIRARLLDLFPDIKILDELNYQLIMFGFLFLTAGIITGAVWANSAWGRYWGWDPKETWSLITWFVYAALLHARMMRGWHGRRIAYMSIIGFMAVLFTYFGVNLLPGLHSYGVGGQ